MKSRKVLKEGMQIVCCLSCGKGEYLEKEVMRIVEVTTRWHEGSPWAHSLCLYRRRDPQPESQETPEITFFFFFSGGLTVSLVTVHLAGLRFLFFFISVLGEVVTTGEDGPVLVVLGTELSPFEALTNSPP